MAYAQFQNQHGIYFISNREFQKIISESEVKIGIFKHPETKKYIQKIVVIFHHKKKNIKLEFPYQEILDMYNIKTSSK